MSQIKDIESVVDSPRGKKEYSECSQNEDIHGVSNLNHKCWRNKHFCCCCLGITICSFMILILEILMNPVFYHQLDNMLYNTSVPLESNSTHEDYDIDVVFNDDPGVVAASYTTRHGSSSRLYWDCDKHDFGCCYIYTGCSVSSGILNHEQKRISLRRIEAHDSAKSNCPTLDKLIHNANNKYGLKNSSDIYENGRRPCEDSQYGCCGSLSNGCDYTIRNMNFENSKDTVDMWLANKNRIHYSRMSKDDAKGSNCPKNIDWYITKFENFYPPLDEESDIPWFWIVIGVLIVCWLGNTNK